MPYRLRKARGRELYWVESADGTKHSKDPLPLDTARKQMTALNIAHARKKGHKIPEPEVRIPKREFISEHKRLTRLLGRVATELMRQRREL